MKNLLDDCWGKDADACCLPGAPIETLQLIRQNGARNVETGRDEDFERVTLYATGDRDKYRDTCSPIVGGWRKYDRRPPTGLLMTSLIESQPDQIPSIGSINPLTRFRCQPAHQPEFRDGDFAA